MAIVIFPLCVAAAVGLCVWAAVVVFSGRGTRRMRIAYLGCLVATSIVACFMTLRFRYSPGPDIRVHGWPTPTVVFQRDSANSAWVEFVDPLYRFAIPLNLAYLLSVPSIVFLVLLRRRAVRTPYRADGSDDARVEWKATFTRIERSSSGETP